MSTRQQQAGMTFWGAAFVIAVVVFFFFIGFKLFPFYMEDFKVRSALDSLARDADAGSKSKADLVEILQKRFDIDNVTSVTPTQHLFIESRGRQRVLRISYEAVVPLFYNISALLEFEHVKEVRGTE